MKRVKAACICQTLHFMLKEDLDHTLAVKQVKEEVEHYKRLWKETGPSIRSLKKPHCRMVPSRSRSLSSITQVRLEITWINCIIEQRRGVSFLCGTPPLILSDGCVMSRRGLCRLSYISIRWNGI